MTIAVNVYNAWRSWVKRDPGNDGEFVKNYPDTWAIVQDVIELRKHG